MTDLYRDSYITCTQDGIHVRWYYLWGSKQIPYSHIHSATMVTLSAVRGKYRIWGTGNPRYWASLDPGRPGKDKGVILDLGGRVRPLLTPDDVPAFTQVLTEQAHLAEVPDVGLGPMILAPGLP
jgi:hypothetical protein